MMAGKKQQKTTNAAAIHLNMIFRTDQNGISKSTTDTRCDGNGGGAVVAAAAAAAMELAGGSGVERDGSKVFRAAGPG